MNNQEPNITIFPETVIVLGKEQIEVYKVPELVLSFSYVELAEFTKFVAEHAKIVNERLNKEKADAMQVKLL